MSENEQLLSRVKKEFLSLPAGEQSARAALAMATRPDVANLLLQHPELLNTGLIPPPWDAEASPVEPLFHQRLEAAMAYRHIGSPELAKLMRCNRGTPHRWLHGALPSSDRLRHLAEVLQCPMDWLAGNTAPPVAAVSIENNCHERVRGVFGWDLGERLIIVRDYRQLTRGAGAQLIGCSTGQLAEWESGEKQLDPNMALRCAAVYGCDVRWLATGTGVAGYYEPPTPEMPQDHPTRARALAAMLWLHLPASRQTLAVLCELHDTAEAALAFGHKLPPPLRAPQIDLRALLRAHQELVRRVTTLENSLEPAP